MSQQVCVILTIRSSPIYSRCARARARVCVCVKQIDVENSPVDEDLRLNVECQANLDQPEDELKDPFFGYKRLEVRISAPEPAE